ncbi:MAG: 16S rRNA (guanine(527)-N(7))-methyltransferase RsmG [Proteobacteria bacterium]|nr:16S rRNA (guanine(527)-N(7))-methyltransferase RsmG [Pseudomonadota bacterium]MBU1057042.1 16S rRNA (guanine(527)-N(7))-methyltransferase RsmG [Pseudomonadota bacterium]
MAESFDFIAGLRSGCEALGLSCPDAAAEERLGTYFRELKHWSRKINLIAKGATDQEILEKHFLDSLTLLPLLSGERPHLLDVGTGAGFPGLVCKAVDPALQVTLVEPRLKRVSFLRHVSRTLGLSDASVVACRVEDEEMLPGDSGFTHITSRAVSEIKLFLEMSHRFAGTGVQVICMKGPKWEEELAAWKDSASSACYTLLSRREYVLPVFQGRRNLLVFAPRACRG